MKGRDGAECRQIKGVSEEKPKMSTNLEADLQGRNQGSKRVKEVIPSLQGGGLTGEERISISKKRWEGRGEFKWMKREDSGGKKGAIVGKRAAVKLQSISWYSK